MEIVPAAQRDELRADILSAREAGAHAIGPERTKSTNKTWATWTAFCLSFKVDSLLQDVDDPILFFQAFGTRVRDGRLSPSGKPVRARSVEDAWRKVGQTMASMEDPPLHSPHQPIGPPTRPAAPRLRP